MKDTYICLNPSQEWDPGNGCCWTISGESCSSDSDCCGTNHCSAGKCCPEYYEWDGYSCVSTADDDSDACLSMGGEYDFLGDWRWTNGNEKCVLSSTDEYKNYEDYEIGVPD
ncbi:MAG: hypothetical protein R6V04_07015 [bacterium]